jgi:hypothetical protein
LLHVDRQTGGRTDRETDWQEIRTERINELWMKKYFFLKKEGKKKLIDRYTKWNKSDRERENAYIETICNSDTTLLTQHNTTPFPCLAHWNIPQIQTFLASACVNELMFIVHYVSQTLT